MGLGSSVHGSKAMGLVRGSASSWVWVMGLGEGDGLLMDLGSSCSWVWVMGLGEGDELLVDLVVTPRSTSANRRWSCSVDLLTRSFSVISGSTMLITNFGFSQSALEVGLRTRKVQAHGHFTLLFQLIVTCSSLVGVYGSKRLGDFWVLDTDIWQWSELTSFGDLPSPQDFAAASAIGNRKYVWWLGW
ncbi:uncharacterized protein LOC112009056 [Quercus suber]|uniref:uncharacterized protein LOC112009056 n=1 Tax=Quercus suber TaxID=58331 RepID=UPI0032DFF240